MTQTELWVTYLLASRAHLKDALTTQLVEFDNLVDLEDVLDYVFCQGFVEAQYRSASWWETKDRVRLKACLSIEEVLRGGLGKCPETSLRLVIQDVPDALWFTYIYKHNPTAPVVTQRIKLPASPTTPSGCQAAVAVKMELLAHLTNYIFSQGYLAPKYRTVVHWEGLCGKKIEECTSIAELLGCGVGGCDEKPLKLVIDAPHSACHVVKPVCPEVHPVHEHPTCPVVKPGCHSIHERPTCGVVKSECPGVHPIHAHPVVEEKRAVFHDHHSHFLGHHGHHSSHSGCHCF